MQLLNWADLCYMLENRNRRKQNRMKGNLCCLFVCLLVFLLLLIQQNSFNLVFRDYFCGYKVRKIYFEMKALESVENIASFKVQFWGRVMHLEHKNAR